MNMEVFPRYTSTAAFRNGEFRERALPKRPDSMFGEAGEHSHTLSTSVQSAPVNTSILRVLPSRSIGPARVSVRRMRKSIRNNKPAFGDGNAFDRGSIRRAVLQTSLSFTASNKIPPKKEPPELPGAIVGDWEPSDDAGRSSSAIPAYLKRWDSTGTYISPRDLQAQGDYPAVHSMSNNASPVYANHAGAGMLGNLHSRRTQLDLTRPLPRSKLSCWDGISFKMWKLKKRVHSHIEDAWFTFGFWRTSLKRIEGRFGTSVVAYFTFLRAMFFLNFLLTALTMSFVVAPQIVSGDKTPFLNTTESTEWDQVIVDSIVGRGALRQSVVYYGIYNSYLEAGSYDMSTAYLLVGFTVLLVSFIWVLWSIGKSHHHQQLQKLNTAYQYTDKVFSAWNFGITNSETAKLKAIATSRELEECIGDERSLRQKKSWLERFFLYHRRLLVNILIAGMLAGAAYCIYLATNVSIAASTTTLELKSNRPTSEKFLYYAKSLASSLTIAAFNAVLPIVFEAITSYEKWRTPSQEVKYTLIRTVAIRLASIGVVIVSLFLRLKDCHTKNIKDSPECGCWELSVGQEFYQLAVLNFLIVLIATWGDGLGQCFLYRKSAWYAKTIGPPNFPLVRSVLDLLYTQMIIWLGFFFSPVLPAIGVVSLFCLFYAKKWTLLWFMLPSTKPHRGYRNSKLFYGMLLLVLCLSLVPLGFVAFESRPSSQCGPFKGEVGMYSAFTKLLRNGPGWIDTAIRVILSYAVAVPTIILLLLIAFYYRVKARAHSAEVGLLQDQVNILVTDKNFLVEKFQALDASIEPKQFDPRPRKTK
eukprot:scpid45750/ scgid10806/ Transmembrane channel-like protein 7